MANALSDITTDAGALEVFLNLNSNERTKLREVLEGIAARIKEFARNLTGVESRILIKDADALKKFAKELSAQLDTAGKQAQKNTANSGVKYSFVDNISKSKESKFIINTINNNIHKVDNNTIFEVHSEDVSTYKTKSDYVLDVFNDQGNIAYNTTLGIVELSRKGAKSTTFHGFGSVKLAATRAIKSVIEKGKIIYSEENYLGKGYDRHIIAARGLINDTPSIVGVIVQSYPRQKFNSKFYLHEAITIEVASHIMTGTVDGAPVSETTSINIILSEADSVKQKQLEIIEKTNPAPDTYHTWIRSVDDIKTLAETLEDDDWSEGGDFNPDLSSDDIQEAIERGSITVYSSYPIKDGVFVSPSRMEAESYSGTGRVYEKTVDIRDVAWIDPTQGMYANVTNQDIKKSSFTDEEYLAAVEREDMEAAQALVDEAAERKFRNSKARDMDGKLIKVYHGTESDVFYEFDKNRRGQTDSSL